MLETHHFFFVAFELVLKSKNTIYAPVEEMIIWKTNGLEITEYFQRLTEN